MHYIHKQPEEAEPYIQKLEAEWVNNVQLLNKLEDHEWKEYDFPMGLVKLMKLHLKKVYYTM